MSALGSVRRAGALALVGGAIAWAAIGQAAPPPRLLSWESAVRGSEEREVRQPVALAAGATGELLVADAFRSRLLVLRADGQEWQVVRAVALPASPSSLAHDGRRYLVSLRQGRGLMAVEGSDHQLQPVLLPAGVVPGALAGIPGGGFLVHDRALERVLRLSADGAVAGEVAGTGQIAALAATADGGMVTARPEEGNVRRYDAVGRLQATWEIPGEGPVPAWPQGVVVEPGGTILVLDRHNARVVALDATGKVLGFGSRKGWEPGLLLFPAGLARLADGRLAVADQGNGRVQVFIRSPLGER